MDSTYGKGSRFSFLLPLTTETSSGGRLTISSPDSSRSSLAHSSKSAPYSSSGRGSEIDHLVQALSASHVDGSADQTGPPQIPNKEGESPVRTANDGKIEIVGSANPLKPVKVDGFDLDNPVFAPSVKTLPRAKLSRSPPDRQGQSEAVHLPQLRILIVEASPLLESTRHINNSDPQDNDINRMILAKRLSLDGHTVVNTTNGQEGLEVVEADRNFDCVLMDIQFVQFVALFELAAYCRPGCRFSTVMKPLNGSARWSRITVSSTASLTN